MSIKPVVLLTRPRRESRLAARALAAAGFTVIRMPLQSTRRAPRSAALDGDIGWASAASIQVFVSRAAVVAAWSAAPSAIAAADARLAVGRATAAALHQLGVATAVAPSDAEDSDGVLGLASLQHVAGVRAAIWAAPGGRDRIARVLCERGAEVRMIPIYRRLPRRAQPSALRQLRAVGESVVLTASSSTLLDQLDQTLVAARLTALRARPLIVASARIAEHARALGFIDVHVARGAAPEATIATLSALKTGAQRGDSDTR